MAFDIDFFEPQSTISINGFPVSFRPLDVQDVGRVWVPRGISRNEEYGHWRIYLVHEKGQLLSTISDSGDPVSSLRHAYQELVQALEQGLSRFSVDRRVRSPGRSRDPVIDTSFTGVTMSRILKGGKKKIDVQAQQMIEVQPGRREARKWYAGAVSEKEFDQDPVGATSKLYSLIKKAVAVRRTYNTLRVEGEFPTAVLHYEDVPRSIRAKSVDLPQFNLQDIFDSYVVYSAPQTQFTTGIDPAALVVNLQDRSLTTRLEPVYLNGFELDFRETKVDGYTVFLPKGLYRAGSEWKIRVKHRNGVFFDAIPDAPQATSPLESLHEAWQYYLSTLRTLTP